VGSTARLQAAKASSSWRDTRPGAMSHSGIQNHLTSKDTRPGGDSRCKVGMAAGQSTPRPSPVMTTANPALSRISKPTDPSRS